MSVETSTKTPVEPDSDDADSADSSYNVQSERAQDLRAIFDAHMGEPLTTTDVGELADIDSRETVRYNLDGLAENGLIERKQAGGRAVVYWRPHDDADGRDWSPSVEAAIRELRIHGRGGPLDLSRAAWDRAVNPLLKDTEGFSTHLNPVIYSEQYDDDGEPIDPREGVEDPGTLAVIDYLTGVHSLAGANWTNQGAQKKVLWPAMKEELLSHPDVYQTPRGGLLWSGRGLPPAELPRHMKG